MRRNRTPVVLWLLVTATAGAGCATAKNYLDSNGPVYRGSSDAAPQVDADIRVVTFNIAYALRVDRAIEALRAHPALRSADVLVLQEMDAPGTEAIARALQMNYVYYPVSLNPKYDRDFGNAVLSPWPIEESRKLLLPHTSRILKQGRAAVAARVRVGGRTVQVYSVHLGAPFGTSPGNRREQAAAILADASAISEPVIVAGDFNSHSVGSLFEAQGFAWPTKSVGNSVRGFSFDHIFVRGLRLTGSAAGVARDVEDASDHRPVWAELDMDSKPPAKVPALASAPSGPGAPR